MPITWKIEALETVPNLDGKVDVVRTVHWRAFKTRLRDPLPKLQASLYGSVSIPTNDLSSFVQFEKLSEAQVVEWVKARLNFDKPQSVALIEANLDKQLDELASPSVQITLPPWGNSVSP